MILNIFSNQNFCHLCELLLWMLGAFLIGYFFWRWWYKNKCQNEIEEWRRKYKDLEHKINTTVKASKVTAPGVFDPQTSVGNFVDGVAKASNEVIEETSVVSSLATKTDEKKSTQKNVSEPKIATKDDLTKVEGIGPKIQGLLHDDNILSFSNLADTKVSSLKTILDNAGPRYRMHDPATWPKQARLAANGEWEKLQKWQDELKGGVKSTKKPDDSVKDDLTKVEGIGPKIMGLLNEDGIWSFKQLSKVSVNRLQKILDNAGSRYRMHNPGTWPEQAKLAASNKWDELQKWQDELKGGR